MTQSTTDKKYVFTNVPPKELRHMEDFARLTQMHHQEINPHGVELDLQWDTFEQMHERGNLQVTIVDYDYEIVGYCVMNVYTNIQYNEVQAKQAALYIKPEHRGGVGTALIDAVDTFLRDNNVTSVTHSVPVGQKWEKALEKLNYKEIETNYMRIL